MNFVKKIFGSKLVQGWVTGEVRHLATVAAGFIMSLALSHGFTNVDATNVSQGVAAIVLGLFGYGMSKLNASNQTARAEIAAQTGSVVSPHDAPTIIARVDAAAPANKATLLEALAKEAAQ